MRPDATALYACNHWSGGNQMAAWTFASATGPTQVLRSFNHPVPLKVSNYSESGTLHYRVVQRVGHLWPVRSMGTSV